MNININVVPEEDTVIPMEVDMAVTDGSGVESVNGKTGAVVLTAKDVGAMAEGYRAPVTAVNGKIGNVVLYYYDVGALPNTTIVPTRTSQLQNDSGFITSAPVSSVNGMTGAVVIGNASTTSAGLMSATDKSDLNTLMDDYSSALVALGVIT